MTDTYPISQLYVERHGSGPSVLFVHGGEEAGGATAFAEQMTLAQHFTLIWPDLPGHGKSPAQGHKNADRDSSILAELLGEGVHLVGHSYGGAVALRLAALNPDRVHSLTLIEPATFDIALNEPAVLELLQEIVVASQIPDLRLRLETFAKAVGIHKTWTDPLSEPYRRLAEDLPTLQTPNAIPSRKFAEMITASGIPTLLISGGHRAAFETLCDVMAQVLQAERAVISGYGHAPQYSGELFNTCLESFWSRHAV
jgi:pimeloyl-ACP methyl ester carboxylesterase